LSPALTEGEKHVQAHRSRSRRDCTDARRTGREIKEWQAIMDYLRRLPVKSKGELPVIPVDERAAEVRAIKS